GLHCRGGNADGYGARRGRSPAARCSAGSDGGRGFFRKRARLRQILVGLILCAAFFVVLQVFPDTGRFFVYTTEGDVKTHWTQFTRGELPLVLKKAAWMGFGTGSLSQGLNYVAGGAEAFDFASRESEGVGVEYGLAKVT